MLYSDNIFIAMIYLEDEPKKGTKLIFLSLLQVNTPNLLNKTIYISRERHQGFRNASVRHGQKSFENHWSRDQQKSICPRMGGEKIVRNKFREMGTFWEGVKRES